MPPHHGTRVAVRTCAGRCRPGSTEHLPMSRRRLPNDPRKTAGPYHHTIKRRAKEGKGYGDASRRETRICLCKLRSVSRFLSVSSSRGLGSPSGNKSKHTRRARRWGGGGTRTGMTTPSSVEMTCPSCIIACVRPPIYPEGCSSPMPRHDASHGGWRRNMADIYPKQCGEAVPDLRLCFRLCGGNHECVV